MSEGEDKVKATVYRERAPPVTAIDQMRALEAETLQEENSERARFMDLRERLAHALSMIDDELMARELNGGLKPNEKEIFEKRFAALQKDLGDASFPNTWARTGEQLGMRSADAMAYNYQVLNAKLSVSHAKAKALLVRLGIYPRESAEEAENRMEMKVFARPKSE